MRQYTGSDFVWDRFLSNGIRFGAGHFILEDGRILYAFVFGFPNRNEDYFEYTQIGKEEHTHLLGYQEQQFSSLSLEEARSQFYDIYVQNRRELCNDFPEGTQTYKPFFTDDEIR